MIQLKSVNEIKVMRQNGAILAQLVEGLQQRVRPGVSTLALDEFAESEIRKAGAVPAFKGYRGYPASICASINAEVVHGIPSKKRRLQEGDLVSIDVGLVKEGFCADMAVTVPVGKVSPEVEKLLQVTRESLAAAIEQARVGNRLGDVSHAVEAYVVPRGYSVVREYVGHGIGRAMHEEPAIPNFGPAGKGPRLDAGMVLAIEPMVNVGGHEVRVLDDGWTVVTRDGSLSAHFEHTVAVTENGPEILTLSQGVA